MVELNQVVQAKIDKLNKLIDELPNETKATLLCVACRLFASDRGSVIDCRECSTGKYLEQRGLLEF